MIIKKIEDRVFTPITIAITLESEEDVIALSTIVRTDVDAVIRESTDDTIRTTDDITKKHNLRNCVTGITTSIWRILSWIPE